MITYLSYGTAVVSSLTVCYYTICCVKKIICNQVSTLMKKNDIIEDRDITFNCDKNKLFLDIFSRGNLALGEAYMMGLWDTPDLHKLICKLARNNNRYNRKYSQGVIRKLINPFIENQTSAIDMINRHYNLSNDFFASWLDENMQYSCAYWNQPEMSLSDAQLAKMHLIGRKLKLEPGMTVLDIGCGWGMLAQYLSENFNVSVIGINLSTEHLKYANARLAEKPTLQVQYILGDFAEISKLGLKFDRIVSVGAYEHFNNRYDEFYKIVYENLKDDGIFLLHTIGSNNGSKGTDEWMVKYIFSKGRIPQLADITTNAQNNGFVIEDMHNFGLDYARTLLEWTKRFEESNSTLKDDIKFTRMWRYYLAVCSAFFEEQNLHLWQFVLTKKGSKIRYTGER